MRTMTDAQTALLIIWAAGWLMVGWAAIRRKRMNTIAQEYIRRCERTRQSCENYLQMRKAFLKKGMWLGCTLCCLACRNTGTCRTACMYARQIKMEGVK